MVEVLFLTGLWWSLDASLAGLWQLCGCFPGRAMVTLWMLPWPGYGESVDASLAGLWWLCGCFPGRPMVTLWMLPWPGYGDSLDASLAGLWRLCGCSPGYGDSVKASLARLWWLCGCSPGYGDSMDASLRSWPCELHIISSLYPLTLTSTTILSRQSIKSLIKNTVCESVEWVCSLWENCPYILSCLMASKYSTTSFRMTCEDQHVQHE